jgi:hypothetical protein
VRVYDRLRLGLFCKTPMNNYIISFFHPSRAAVNHPSLTHDRRGEQLLSDTPKMGPIRADEDGRGPPQPIARVERFCLGLRRVDSRLTRLASARPLDSQHR